MLELIDDAPPVIFTTAFEEYAIKAFEANAADYLLKPFSKERFDRSMEKMMLQKSNSAPFVESTLSTPQQNRIVLKDNGKIKIIPITTVDYLEASDDYIKIHTKEGVFLKKKTMQFFEDSLPANEFTRIHRSYIINTQLITRIDVLEKENHSVLLATGAKLPLRKS